MEPSRIVCFAWNYILLSNLFFGLICAVVRNVWQHSMHLHDSRLIGLLAIFEFCRFMYKNAGHLRKPTVFLFTEAEIKDEVRCNHVWLSELALASRGRSLRMHVTVLYKPAYCYSQRTVLSTWPSTARSFPNVRPRVALAMLTLWKLCAALEGFPGGDELGAHDRRNPWAFREGRDDGHDGRPQELLPQGRSRSFPSKCCWCLFQGSISYNLKHGLRQIGTPCTRPRRLS